MGKWLLLMLLSPSVWAITDPTAPLGIAEPVAEVVAAPSRVTAAPMPRLDSILCREQCSAVINGQVVAKGDEVAGFTIQDISAQQVALSRGGRRVNLTMFPEFIKQ